MYLLSDEEVSSKPLGLPNCLVLVRIVVHRPEKVSYPLGSPFSSYLLRGEQQVQAMYERQAEERAQRRAESDQAAAGTPMRPASATPLGGGALAIDLLPAAATPLGGGALAIEDVAPAAVAAGGAPSPPRRRLRQSAPSPSAEARGRSRSPAEEVAERELRAVLRSQDEETAERAAHFAERRAGGLGESGAEGAVSH